MKTIDYIDNFFALDHKQIANKPFRSQEVVQFIVLVS